MKNFLLFGGFLGFVLSLLSSYHAGNMPAYALRDGMIGCLIGALLFRGLHMVYLQAARARFAVRAEELKAEALRRRSVS